MERGFGIRLCSIFLLFGIDTADSTVPISMTRPPSQIQASRGCFVTCMTIDLSSSFGGSKSAIWISFTIDVSVAGEGTNWPDAVNRSTDGSRILPSISIWTLSSILLGNDSCSAERYVIVD